MREKGGSIIDWKSEDDDLRRTCEGGLLGNVILNDGEELLKKDDDAFDEAVNHGRKN
jgi:hypothetical protein